MSLRHRLSSRWWIGPALRLAVSAALILLVCRRIDLHGLAGQFAAQSPVWVIAAAIVTLAQIGLAALRWQQILLGLGIRAPTETVLSVSYTASFFNAWLLGTMGGDVARAVLAPPGARGRAVIVHSVLLDRIVTFAGIGYVILPITLLGTGPLAHSLPLMVALIAALLPLALLPFLVPLVRFIGQRMPFFWLAAGLGDSWSELQRARHRLAATQAIAVLSALALALTPWCLARAQSLDVSFADFLMLMPPVVLLTGLPISVGGWGVREGAMIAALATVGVGASTATLLSVQIGALAAVLSIPAGALWLWRFLAARRPLDAPRRVAPAPPRSS